MGRLTATASGSVASFKTPAIAPIQHLKAHFTPVQEGTGDPSPSNVRAITGWTGLTAYRGGKNLLNFNQQPTIIGSTTSTINKKNGNLEISGTDIAQVGFSLWLPIDATVTFSFKINFASIDSFLRQRIYKISNGVASRVANTIIDSSSTYITTTYITESEADYAFIITAQNYQQEAPDGKLIVSDWQVESGSVATAYEVCNMQTFPISWSSSGTVYGGYVDLITGEVWQTHKYSLLNDENLWSHYTTIDGVFYYKYDESFSDRLLGTATFSDGNYCSIASRTNSSIYPMARWQGKNSYYFLVVGSMSLDDIKGLARDNTISICYKLATPVLVTTLTPTALNALIGTNNLWNSANGDTEVEYDFAETAEMMQIRQRIMAQRAMRLPPEYQEVKYIKTKSPWVKGDMSATKTYNSFICTDIRVDNIGKIICRYKIINYEKVGSYYPMFIASHTFGGTAPTVPYAAVGQIASFKSMSPMGTPVIGEDNVYTIINTLNGGYYLRIGGWTDWQWTAEGAYYYVYVYDRSDNAIAKFIPCYRKSDNKPGMYDLISATFHPSDGGEDFEIGGIV